MREVIRLCLCLQYDKYVDHLSTHAAASFVTVTAIVSFSIADSVAMAQFRICLVILAIVAAAARSDPNQDKSLAVSHCTASTVSITQVNTQLIRHISADTRFALVKRFRPFNCTKITTNASKNVSRRTGADTDADADGAHAIRTAANSREWVLNLVNTIVMGLLGLVTLVITVVFGLKQLRDIKTQLQAMLDIYNHRPRVNEVEMNDVESELIDSGGDGMQVRPSVDPAQRATSSSSSSFLESGFHVIIPNHQPPTRLRDHGQAEVEPRRLANEDGISYNESQRREDEGQMYGKVMTAAGSCIQLDRQDPYTLDLEDRKLEFPLIRIQALTDLVLAGRRSV
jgi:hypothetical protein